MARRWIHKPEGARWGEFGDDDQVGRLNLLTADRVRRAAQEIREGRTFCLSLPLDYPGGRALAAHRFPPELRPTERKGRAYFNFPFAKEGAYCDCGNDDAALIALQYSTQWDSLAHIGMAFDIDGDGVEELVYYNGFRADIDVIAPADRAPGASPGTRLGIENFAETGVQGRGVLVDLHMHVGNARCLIGYRDLMQVIAADGVEIEEGDILCLHTGFSDLVLSMNRNPDAGTLHTSCAVLDGSDQELLRWLDESRIAALVADNYAVESIPSRRQAGLRQAYVPLHVHCLCKLGMPLGELWNLGPLARWLRAAGRSRFFLTAPPLRLPGAMGSPVTPVATV